MNLHELNTLLADNIWHRGADDVEIIVDNGNGDAYVLDRVYDYGNHIALIGDNTKSVDITDEMIEAFGRAWADAPPGAPDDRRRAGLRAALAVRR